MDAKTARSAGTTVLIGAAVFLALSALVVVALAALMFFAGGIS